MSPEEIILDMLEAFQARGSSALLDAFEDHFTDDFVWIPAMVGSFEGGTYRGRDGFARYFADFEAIFADLRFSKVSVREVEPGTVLVLCRIHMRGQESGVPIERDIGYVFTFEDGRIVRGETFMSQEEAEAGAHAKAR